MGWTKDDCRDRYVRGSRISLRQLADESENSVKTLYDWSRFDEPKWSIQREQFQGEVRVKTDRKAIEKTSNQMSRLSDKHLSSYQVARSVIDKYFSWLNDRLDKVKDIPELLEAELKNIRPSNVNFMVLALERTIHGEREAAGLDWENVPKAISFLNRLGYAITDPSLPSESDSEAEGEATPKGFTDEQAGEIRARILGLPSGATSPAALPSEVDIRESANSGC